MARSEKAAAGGLPADVAKLLDEAGEVIFEGKLYVKKEAAGAPVDAESKKEADGDE